MIKTIAKIIRIIGIIILIISIVWGAFLAHYILGMIALGLSAIAVGILIVEYREL